MNELNSVIDSYITSRDAIYNKLNTFDFKGIIDKRECQYYVYQNFCIVYFEFGVQKSYHEFNLIGEVEGIEFYQIQDSDEVFNVSFSVENRLNDEEYSEIIW